MSGKRLFAVTAVGLIVLAGCDDRSKGPAPSSRHPDPAPTEVVAMNPSPDTKPVMASAQFQADPPTTQPIDPPHSSFIVADGRSPQPVGYNFPRARLHINRDDKTVVLYSDDPKNAIDSKYVGNGYYIEIKLADDFVQHLNGYQWHFKAVSSEHQDSTDGIFLEGQRYHLQPSDIVVSFAGDGPTASVTMQGTFYEFDMTQGAREGSLVKVEGMVSATVDPAK